MYPHESTYRKTPDGVTSHMLNVAVLGPSAASYLAAKERQLEAQRYAAQWTATHPHPNQKPCSWRQWSGKLLVRVGHRLEGVASSIEAEIQPATH